MLSFLDQKEDNNISSQIIACGIAVHRNLGPGLLESTYQKCLVDELRKCGLHVEENVPLPLMHEGRRLPKAYFIDLLVEGVIVLELKAVELVTELHRSQLLTYLKIGNYRLGLLLNFNVRLFKQGIHRMVNKF